jgi:hypothetical protein
MEENNLSITTTNTYFIIGNCLNAFDTLSTHILSKYKQFILHLKAAKISRLCSSKEKLLIGFAENQAGIVPH